MKPPGFWLHRGPAAIALAPLSRLYSALHRRKWQGAKPYEAGIPVLCVGNLTLGGSGKTPVVRALRQRARAAGIDAHVLLRGHGGALPGPVLVDPSHHEADAVGDEALLHASDGPAWVSRDRAAGAKKAAMAGAQLLILDDGFQNPSLHKDVSILVIDAESGLGNGCVFPAGPLREPADFGLRRAQGVILMGDGPRPAVLDRFDGPILSARLQAAQRAPEGPLFAFAGIGRPEKLFDSLNQAGAELAGTRRFSDHHRYSDRELAGLRDEAERLNARLITTEKDSARLPAASRGGILTWPVRAVFENDRALDLFLAPLLDAARGRA